MSDEQHLDEPNQSDPELSTGELLRGALVDDDDPRFPLWLPIPAVLVTTGWALYDATAGGGSVLPTLLWPGAAIFVGTAIATWLGWQLEID